MVLAAVVEVVAVLDDLDAAWPACSALEFLGGVAVALLLVAAYRQHRALDLRRKRYRVRHRRNSVEKALGRDHVPPARHEDEVASAPRPDQRARLLRQLCHAIAREQALGSTRSRRRSCATAPCRSEERRVGKECRSRRAPAEY